MAEIAVIGLDLAKTVFQVHGVSTDGEVVVRRQLRRSQVLAFFERLPRCLIGMEACASAHHWGRELTALGHEVKLMPPAYVKAYVKRGKTDTGDAEAIAEAVTRPTMRFVPIKSKEQQAVDCAPAGGPHDPLNFPTSGLQIWRSHDETTPQTQRRPEAHDRRSLSRRRATSGSQQEV